MFKECPATELAHDISHAVFRVAKLVRHRKLRAELEGAAVDLVLHIDLESAKTLHRIVRLSEAVGEMNSINSSVLCRELRNFSDILRKEIAGLPSTEAVKLDDIFRVDVKREDVPVYISEVEYVNEPPELKRGQLAVLQFIRQFPDNCRMRDLIAKFPDVSERTLRNDIQRLMNGGLVERAGGRSGPLSYIRAAGAIDES